MATDQLICLDCRRPITGADRHYHCATCKSALHPRCSCPNHHLAATRKPATRTQANRPGQTTPPPRPARNPAGGTGGAQGQTAPIYLDTTPQTPRRAADLGQTRPIQPEITTAPARPSPLILRIMLIGAILGVLLVVAYESGMLQWGNQTGSQTPDTQSGSKHYPTSTPKSPSAPGTLQETPAVTLGSTADHVVVRTNPGNGAYLRDSPAWSDHRDIVIPEGGELDVLQSAIWSENRFWYFVRVVATGMTGYVPVELTVATPPDPGAAQPTPPGGTGSGAGSLAESGNGAPEGIAARVVVRTARGGGAYLRNSPVWGDHGDIVIPEGGELEVLQSTIWSEGRFWSFVRVVATGETGYIPVELTSASVPGSSAAGSTTVDPASTQPTSIAAPVSAQPTIAPRR